MQTSPRTHTGQVHLHVQKGEHLSTTHLCPHEQQLHLIGALGAQACRRRPHDTDSRMRHRLLLVLRDTWHKGRGHDNRQLVTETPISTAATNIPILRSYREHPATMGGLWTRQRRIALQPQRECSSLSFLLAWMS
jgi:hypothetical protein